MPRQRKNPDAEMSVMTSGSNSSTIPLSAPAAQAAWLHQGVVAALQMHCGCQFGDKIADIKRLLESIKLFIPEVRDGSVQCEKAEGYMSMTQRASQRVAQQSLRPDFELWAHCMEPDSIRQVEDDLTDLIETAEAAQAELERLVHGAQHGPWKPGEPQRKPMGVPMAVFAYSSGPKSLEAARAKAHVVYGPCERNNCYRHVLDYARLGLVFQGYDQLQQGIEEIISSFEVHSVRNYVKSPNALGLRYVEVAVVVVVTPPGAADPIPHVCELRLEDINAYRMRQALDPHLVAFEDQVRSLADGTLFDPTELVHVARSALTAPQAGNIVRSFRRALVRQFGNAVNAFRKYVREGARLLSFQRFKELCQVLKIQDHTVDIWMALCRGKSGGVSLFEMDPDATGVLIRVGASMLAAMNAGGLDGDPDGLYQHLTRRASLVNANRISENEWRTLCKGFGVQAADADRTFSYLDSDGKMNPPAYISPAEVWWLCRLPLIVDITKVVLWTPDRPGLVQDPQKYPWVVARQAVTKDPVVQLAAASKLGRVRARSAESRHLRQSAVLPSSTAATLNTTVMIIHSKVYPHLNGQYGTVEDWDALSRNWVIRLCDGRLYHFPPLDVQYINEVKEEARSSCHDDGSVAAGAVETGMSAITEEADVAGEKGSQHAGSPGLSGDGTHAATNEGQSCGELPRESAVSGAFDDEENF